MTNLPMFFVFSIPRSGTTWLASYLAVCNPEWMICHEAHNRDFAFDTHCAFRPWIADEYVNEERHQRITEYTERKKPGAHGYGEVTPRLRYISAAIMRKYPQAKCVHLVRDPRTSVPSLINYGYYHPTKGRAHRRSAPINLKWTREQRTAWAWAYGHNRIRQNLSDFVRFEDLLEDFSVMESLAEKLGVNADRTKWEKRRKIKVNKSNQTHPIWTGYAPSQREAVKGMVKGEAQEYGYLTE